MAYGLKACSCHPLIHVNLISLQGCMLCNCLFMLARTETHVYKLIRTRAQQTWLKHWRALGRCLWTCTYLCSWCSSFLDRFFSNLLYYFTVCVDNFFFAREHEVWNADNTCYLLAEEWIKTKIIKFTNNPYDIPAIALDTWYVKLVVVLTKFSHRDETANIFTNEYILINSVFFIKIYSQMNISRSQNNIELFVYETFCFKNSKVSRCEKHFVQKIGTHTIID